MYRCDQCQKVTQPYQSCLRVTVQDRARTYTNDEGLVSQGREIVREEKVCPDCLKKAQDPK